MNQTYTLTTDLIADERTIQIVFEATSFGDAEKKFYEYNRKQEEDLSEEEKYKFTTELAKIECLGWLY